MAKSLKGAHHAHGCKRCVTRYTDACLTPAVDDLCTACGGGLAWQVLIGSASPKDCCREQARLVTKDEKATYALAGTRLWFICRTCSRTHPFNPRTETRNP